MKYSESKRGFESGPTLSIKVRAVGRDIPLQSTEKVLHVWRTPRSETTQHTWFPLHRSLRRSMSLAELQQEGGGVKDVRRSKDQRGFDVLSSDVLL